MTETITISFPRSIGGIDVQCTLREQHRDRVTKTRHPVEAGAPITDHAFREPAIVTIEAGWSNSSAAAKNDKSYVSNTYNSLLKLINPPQLLMISTGKRIYYNMVMVDLGVTTDEETEAVLAVTATFEEVIQVSTQSVTAPASAQANPQKTAPVQNNGSIQPVPSAVVPAASTGGG